MGGVKDQPPRFEEDLSRTRSRATFRSLFRQLQLQLPQLFRIFSMLHPILGIELNEIRRWSVPEHIAGHSSEQRTANSCPHPLRSDKEEQRHSDSREDS